MARLLLDVMLGKLAVYLRMCGHDAAYALDRGIEDDDRLRELAAAEDRRLVTRDEQLAARTDDAILLDARDVTDQLRQISHEGVDLSLPEHPTRCGRCNGKLVRVDGNDPAEELPDYVPEDQPVYRCRDCGQYFWEGSHWDDVRSRLEAL